MQADVIAEEIDVASFIDVGAEVATVRPPPTDNKIVAGLLETENVSDDDNSTEVEDKSVKCPDGNELLQVIETLKRFVLLADKEYKIQLYANPFGDQINRHFSEKRKQ